MGIGALLVQAEGISAATTPPAQQLTENEKRRIAPKATPDFIQGFENPRNLEHPARSEQDYRCFFFPHEGDWLAFSFYEEEAYATHGKLNSFFATRISEVR